jgi:hypothetical protein
LIGITNVLHFGLELSAVRRCMQIAEAGIRTADRLGSVHSSIELRLFLAAYHIDRNEIWVAADVLKEARRRAAAVHDRNLGFIRIMEGDLLLKRGRFLEGLTQIADAISEMPHSAFLFRPVDEVRKHLDALGIKHGSPFIIDLPHEKIPSFVTKISEKWKLPKQVIGSPGKAAIVAFLNLALWAKVTFERCLNLVSLSSKEARNKPSNWG